ncbi:hypothetical protein ACIBQ0_16935 [Nocardia nova]|uniref:hypothetical protein n=1 Tax=Nocardia nova TaxID=37330 RepID=UPI00378BC1CF
MSDNETRDELAEFLREPVPPIHAAASRALEKMYGEWGITPGLPTPAVAVHRMADFLAAEGWRPPARVIETDEELRAAPTGIVVRAKDGTIAARHTTGVGVVFGDNRAFRWSILRAPATVLFEPEEVGR